MFLKKPTSVVFLLLGILLCFSSCQDNGLSDQKERDIDFWLNYFPRDPNSNLPTTLDGKLITSGIDVSYAECISLYGREGLSKALDHARSHAGIVSAWYNPYINEMHYFSDTIFSSDRREEAMEWAKQNNQFFAYDLDNGKYIKVPYPPYDGPARVILDMDLGSSTDDLVTLDMALQYHREGKVQLLGVICDRMGKLNANVGSIFCDYYGLGDIPIGLETDGVVDPHVFIDYAPVLDTLHTADGQLMFHTDRYRDKTYPEAYKLYRKLLAESPDRTVDIVICGFVSSIAQLLWSKPDEISSLSGYELLQQKLRSFYVQGGTFITDNPEPDYNFLQAPEAAKSFFNFNWTYYPTIFNAMETGQSVDYEPDSLIRDIDWTDHHPLKQVYMRCDCNTGQRMWDVMSILHLMVEPELFTLSEYGSTKLNEDCSVIFIPDSTALQRYTYPFTPERSARALDLIRQRIRQH